MFPAEENTIPNMLRRARECFIENKSHQCKTGGMCSYVPTRSAPKGCIAACMLGGCPGFIDTIRGKMKSESRYPGDYPVPVESKEAINLLIDAQDIHDIWSDHGDTIIWSENSLDENIFSQLSETFERSFPSWEEWITKGIEILEEKYE